MENKPGKFACCVLEQGTQWDALPLCGRHVAQTPRKWQLPSECERVVQSIAIQFDFSLMENKYGKKFSNFEWLIGIEEIQ